MFYHRDKRIFILLQRLKRYRIIVSKMQAREKKLLSLEIQVLKLSILNAQKLFSFEIQVLLYGFWRG
jgi:hypothetical protein